VDNRVFLLENDNKYQTFTLMDNELAFDVDLSTVECGIAASLSFVAMDPDGGRSKFPTNEAGAAYGTGYCDASCPRSNKFVGGKANFEHWVPNEYSHSTGAGDLGACCSQFAVWESNAHSFSTSSKICAKDNYNVCTGGGCDSPLDPSPIIPPQCDSVGCDYNPYRIGVPDFYGKGKTLDTKKKFTVVTRFQKTGVAKFFLQDGKKIEAPSSAYSELPDSGALTEGYCEQKPAVFGERDIFAEVGGWDRHLDVLTKPMVLAMSISNDYLAWNLWLDSAWPLGVDSAVPGVARGPCVNEDREPQQTERLWGKAQVAWSNIRFGPIGSTVVV
jgi:cellulose 1,4-beta-cellobiosidase